MLISARIQTVIGACLLAYPLFTLADSSISGNPTESTINEYLAPRGTYSGQQSGKFTATVTLGRRGEGTIGSTYSYSFQFERPSRPALTRAQCDPSASIVGPGECKRSCDFSDSYVKYQSGDLTGIPVLSARNYDCSGNISGGLPKMSAWEAYEICEARNAWGGKTFDNVIAKVGRLFVFNNPRTHKVKSESKKEIKPLQLKFEISKYEEWEYTNNRELIWPYVIARAPVEITCNIAQALKPIDAELDSRTIERKPELVKVNKSPATKPGNLIPVEKGAGTPGPAVISSNPVTFGSKARSMKMNQRSPSKPGNLAPVEKGIGKPEPEMISSSPTIFGSKAESIKMGQSTFAKPGKLAPAASNIDMSIPARSSTRQSIGIKETKSGGVADASIANKQNRTSRPDLTVLSVKLVSSQGKKTGEKATLSAVVKNAGAGPSTETSLFFLRSADRTVNRNDRLLGQLRIPSLKSGATIGKSYTFRYPSSAGSYYFGACVKGVKGEVSNSNNCAKGVVVKLTAVPAARQSGKVPVKRDKSVLKRKKQ